MGFWIYPFARSLWSWGSKSFHFSSLMVMEFWIYQFLVLDGHGVLDLSICSSLWSCSSGPINLLVLDGHGVLNLSIFSSLMVMEFWIYPSLVLDAHGVLNLSISRHWWSYTSKYINFSSLMVMGFWIYQFLVLGGHGVLDQSICLSLMVMEFWIYPFARLWCSWSSESINSRPWWS